MNVIIIIIIYYYLFFSSQGLTLAQKQYKDLKAQLLRIELPNKCHGLQVSVFAGRLFTLQLFRKRQETSRQCKVLIVKVAFNMCVLFKVGRNEAVIFKCRHTPRPPNPNPRVFT